MTDAMFNFSIIYKLPVLIRKHYMLLLYLKRFAYLYGGGGACGSIDGLNCYATSQKVAGSSPDESTEFFQFT
jgi:hypothetical protein